MATSDEQAPLLGAPAGPNLARDTDYLSAAHHAKRRDTVRVVTYVTLTVLFGIALVAMLFFWDTVGRVIGALPKNSQQAALRVLEASPIIVRFCALSLYRAWRAKSMSNKHCNVYRMAISVGYLSNLSVDKVLNF